MFFLCLLHTDSWSISGRDWRHALKKSTLIQIKCFRTNHTQFKIFSIQMKLFSLDSLLGGGGGYKPLPSFSVAG